MRKVVLLLLLLLGYCRMTVAQTTRIDRIRTVVYNTSGKQQYNALFQLFEQRYSMSVDSLGVYLKMAQQLGGDTISDVTGITIEFLKFMGQARTLSAEVLIHKSDSLLSIIKTKNLETDLELKLLHYKAGALVRTGKYKEGLAEYYKVLNAAEKKGNLEYICAAWNGVGWVHMETGKYEEAIPYFRKVMGQLNDTAFNGRPNVIYSNLASCYCTIGKNDSALKYILLVEKNVRQVESLQLLANALAIKSDIMKAMGRNQEVAACLREMVDIRRKIGDVFYIVSDMFVLAQYYSENGECSKGIALCKEALELIDKYNIRVKEMIIREALAMNYKACGDYKNYADELNLLMNLKDSVNKIASSDALAEMEAKYELQKKEERIEKQELMLSKRNYMVFGSMTLLVMALIIGFQYFRNYKNRASIQAKLAVSEAREEERKRIAAELHDNIGTQLGFISRKIDIYKNKAGSEHPSDHPLLEEISNASRRTISDLRETIWALKKEQVDFRELADRLKLHARRQFEGVSEVKVDIGEEISSAIIISPVASLNVFRILQEALYNAAVHSEASAVHLGFNTTQAGEWNIILTDNGKGFDTTREYEHHYGLENMRLRAQESGLVLEIESSGNGTRIVLSGKS
ncbi:MAG: tetratricopeptide repeat protein [Bacteroidia bacterium]